jgi:peptidoglycan/LPS O-acetylase OafA/YrhL
MERLAAIFALSAVCSYAIAIWTCDALVRWILPRRLGDELGRGSRYIAIDGIRGYLAFGVFLHHFLITWSYLGTGVWRGPHYGFENVLGSGPVTIFFMITAFLFWGRAHAQKDVKIKSFFVSRLFRIYPLYMFVVAIVCFIVAHGSHWNKFESGRRIAGEIAQWVSFERPDINKYAHTAWIIASVNWSLRYEAWFYLSLPLLVAVFLKRNALWKKIIALAVCLALFMLTDLDIDKAASFLGGVLAVFWRTSPKRIEWARGSVGAFIAIACLACEAIFWFQQWSIIGIALMTVFFIVLASENTFFGILDKRGSLWLGEISYSIYLCHGIVLWIVVQHILPRIPGFQLTDAWLGLSMIGVTPFLVIGCSATYVFLERPFIDFGHRLAKRKTPKASERNEVRAVVSF